MPPISNYSTGEQLKAEYAKLDAILNSMPDAVYIGDFTGIKKSNQLALDMLGFESVEELNQNIPILAEKIKTTDLQTGKRLSPEEEPFLRALGGETVVKEVHTTHIKTNKRIIVRCAAAPVLLNGKVIAAIAINSDITEQIWSKDSLKRANEELEKKNIALDKYVYITSHDLKAPLNSIGPLLDILKNEYGYILGSEGLNILNMAITKVNGMNSLIHSLLESARNEEKVKESINVLQLVGEIVRDLNIPKSINVYINQGLPLINYHKVSLIQIFQNIISNSVKFMDKKKGRIEIDCHEEETAYIISIQDNGPGINKVDLTKIFDKFYIAHKDSGKDSTGLGLTIVKEIVEEHNGKIWAESIIGEGTIFYFSIPKITSKFK